jgi:hypothetical protein
VQHLFATTRRLPKLSMRLAEKFEANEISHIEALELIREAIKLRDECKENLRIAFGDNDCRLHQFNSRLKAEWKDTHSVDARDRLLALFETFARLWLCVNKHFRPQWQP